MTQSTQRKAQLLQAIADLTDSLTHITPTMSQVAKVLGVSRQRVHQLAVELRAEGQLVPHGQNLILPGGLPNKELEEKFAMSAICNFSGLLVPFTAQELAACMKWGQSRTNKTLKRLKVKKLLHDSKWLVPTIKPEFTSVDYFWSRVNRTSNEDDCWSWLDSTTGGYGHLLWNGKTDYAHRIAYLLSTGMQPPQGRRLHVAHTCANKLCCNPKHLVIRTALETAEYRDSAKC